MRRSVVAITVWVVSVASVLGPSSAGAAPADDALNRAVELERRIAENGAAIDALSEQYNAAVARRDLAHRQIEFGRQATAGLAARRAELAARAGRAAAELYRNDVGSSPLALVRAAGDRDGRHGVEYVRAARRSLEATMREHREIERQLAGRGRSLDRFRVDAQRAADLAEAARAQALLLERRQRELLRGVRGQIADVLALWRASQDPDAAGLELRLRSLGLDALPTPPSPAAAAVVAYAIAQLGKPYVFAAAGPDAFDCSGLTMMAWRQVGVAMPHFAASQYARFPKVSIEELAPGDLVFFYPDIHHVGIYIGGGRMIHAPHTGDVVRVASIYRRSLIGAVRPA